MVGPLLLLKMLHCKQLAKKSTTKSDLSGEGTSYDFSHDVIVKKENEEDLNNLCRVCLKEGNIPIYGDSPDDIPEALQIFGGIDVQADDPYPNSLCVPCHTILQDAILFRKTAQQSDEMLKQTTEAETIQNDNDIADDFEDDLFLCEVQKQPKTQRELDKAKHYFCRRCNLEFKTAKEYSDHRLSDEHDNLRRTCPICNNSYAVLYFKKHLALHNKMQTETYMCDICGKKFIVQGQFTRHRLTHFYKLPYQCSLCPYRGRFSESLKMHMRSHTGEKPYQCSQCPSRFINKSNLNKHMLTHKGEHDFKCDSCGRGFYTKRELDMHFKVDHTGIKDHICTVCGKAFGYRKAMMKHQLKVHKREKMKSGRMPLYLKVETMKRKGVEVVVES